MLNTSSVLKVPMAASMGANFCLTIAPNEGNEGNQCCAWIILLESIPFPLSRISIFSILTIADVEFQSP